MAASIVSEPFSIHPAYNPVVYYFASGEYAFPGFRYVVELFVSGAASPFRTLKIVPAPPQDGFTPGRGYVDISRLLQDNLVDAPPETSFDTGTDTWYDGSDKVFNYDIKVGQEYILNWAYTDFGFYTGNYLAFADLTSTTPHSFVVGDQIQIANSQIYNDCRDQLSGFYTVFAVPDPYTVVTTAAYPPNCTDVAGGTARYADGRVSQFLNQSRRLNRKAFDRAYSLPAFKNYNALDMIPDGVPYPNGQMVTNAPRADFQIKDFQHLTWPFFDNLTNRQQYILFQTSNGGVYRMDITGTAELKMVAVGANAAPDTIIVGTLPMIQPTTQWIKFAAYQDSSATLRTSELFQITIDQDCCKNKMELVFKDRAGAYSSFAFCLNMFEKGTIQRTSFRKELGEQDLSNPFAFNTWDKGLTNFDVNVTKEFTLNTDWMTDGMSVYFEELLTSPEVYGRFVFENINTAPVDVWYAVQILDSTFETQRQQNKKLIRKTVTVRLANNDSINV
jgi:hypothetical protein